MTAPHNHVLNTASAGLGWRRAARWLLRGLLALLLALVAIAAAWVLSNLQDASPVPRPAALALPTAQVSPDRNAAFAMQGLFAAADKDPAQVGRALWALEQEQAQQLFDQAAVAPTPEAIATKQQQLLQATGPLLVVAKTAPWSCDELATNCWATYLAQSDALTLQRQGMALLGARCEALVANPTWVFEELLPSRWHPSAFFDVHLQATYFCGKWWRTAAALAQQRGDAAQALIDLTKANTWHRSVLAGSRSLVAQVVAQTLMRRQLAVVAGVAAQSPAGAPRLLPLLAPLGAPEDDVRRWVSLEAAYNRATLELSFRSNERVDNAIDAEPLPWPLKAIDSASRWLMVHQISLHPQRTLQSVDEGWLALLQELSAGLPNAVLARRQAWASAEAETSTLSWLDFAWRNPVGQLLAGIHRSGYDSYLTRPLDLRLHLQAVTLAVQAQAAQVPPAARAAWAQQQPLWAALQERASWAADGNSLQVRSWAADRVPPGGTVAPRDQIHVSLLPAIP